MNIILHGTLVATEGDVEITKGAPFGLTVMVCFTEGSPYGKSQTFNNVTEVHLNYNQDKRVAIESDYHSTGMTHDTSMIESILIEDATVMAEIY